MRCTRALCAIAQAPVRVRFAPSPTGSLHLGGLRTALFNYLFARAHGGAFLLRIEDTDEERTVPGSVEALQRTLAWCGLAYDEGPGSAGGGAHGPYVQSQRLPLYAAHAARLLASGHAYRCFCTPARLAQLREHQTARGLAPGYDGACRGLAPSAAAARAAAGEASVVRLAVPRGASAATRLQDAVLGEVSFPHSAVDDQVLLKTSGWPTYHLACVVDDHLMAVSHVIRGQEWLPSTPKHLLLYAALGWQAPVFAHLPLLLNPDRTKLSKRKGDAAVEDYAAAGFLPEALIGFVATLGWTPPAGLGPLATLQQLAQAFALPDLHKANAVVDRQRLVHANGLHVREACRVGGGADAHGGARRARVREGALAAVRQALLDLLGPARGASALAEAGVDVDAIMAAQHERVGALTDFGPLLLPFYLRAAGAGAGAQDFGAYMASSGPVEALRRMGGKGALQEVQAAPLRALLPLRPALEAVLAQWEGAQAGVPPGAAVKAAAAAAGIPPGRLMLPVRWALTDMDAGAAFADTLGLLGQRECTARLRLALEQLRAL